MRENKQLRSFLWLVAAGVYAAGLSAAVLLSLQPLFFKTVVGTLPPAPSLLNRFLLADVLFTASTLLCLYLGVIYGKIDFPEASRFSGAWSTVNGRGRNYPLGFPTYLCLAGVVSMLIPAIFALILAAQGYSTISTVTFGGYFLVFVVQTLLEVKFLSRSHMTISIPLIFSPYRLWQLARSIWALQLLKTNANTMLLSLLCIGLVFFWVFDHAVTAVQLPWMLNVHLINNPRRHD